MTANNRLSFTDKICLEIDPEIPKKLLDEIVDASEKRQFEESHTYRGKDPIRTSTQSWIPCHHWISGIIHNIFINANHFFQYDLSYFDSPIQLTRYDKDAKYDWHVDLGQLDKGKLPRKLSMSLLLDDKFEGGEFQFYNNITQEEITIELQTGTVVVFPSWVVHRVKPVTSGRRLSLVAWMNGPQFR